MNVTWTYYILHVVISLSYDLQASVTLHDCHSQSSPVASWDTKVSIVCTLQNLRLPWQ